MFISITQRCGLSFLTLDPPTLVVFGLGRVGVDFVSIIPCLLPSCLGTVLVEVR